MAISKRGRRKWQLAVWPSGESVRPVHRLRDLSREERVAAIVLATMLVLPAVAAFFQFLSEWRPTGDNALIALRTLDVGTSRTPQLGQPSTSFVYGDDEVSVRHLGPWHFYLMAPFVRALGASAGMLVFSVLVTSFSMLMSLFAVFRRLGRRGGVLGAAALGLLLFAIGNASLVNPISSNFARMPLLCAAVLVWAVIAGDDRLLPLTTVMVSVALQEHLSAGPATAVVALAAIGGVSLVWWRAGVIRESAARRRAGGVALVSAALALLLWLPLLLQQVFGKDGNLAALFCYAGRGATAISGSVLPWAR